jgi:AbrB family looped-hinge helix DNA binding protein
MKNKKTAIMSAKGQLVIPSALRKKYGLKSGTAIYFQEDASTIRLVPVTEDYIAQNIGFAGTKGRLTRALREEKMRDMDKDR